MPHDPRILDAIEKNDEAALRDLLKSFISNDPHNNSVNALNPQGETYFHVAVKILLKERRYHKLNILEILIAYGIDTNIRNVTGETALAQEGVDCNGFDNVLSETPLIHAINNELLGLFNVLLNNLANVNKTDKSGVPPLMAAAYHARPFMLNELIKRGANVLACNGFLTNGASLFIMVMNKRNDAGYKHDPIFMRDSAECITILFNHYMGFGVNFSSFAGVIKDINFKGIILLGAKLDDLTKSVNPTLYETIVTVDQLVKSSNKVKELVIDDLNRYKQICIDKASLCKNSHNAMFLRLTKTIHELDDKIKELTLGDHIEETKVLAKSPQAQLAISSNPQETSLRSSESTVKSTPLPVQIVSNTSAVSQGVASEQPQILKTQKKESVLSSIKGIFRKSPVKPPSLAPEDGQKTRTAVPQKPLRKE